MTFFYVIINNVVYLRHNMKRIKSEATFSKGDILESLNQYIAPNVLVYSHISESRKELLDEITEYIFEKVRENRPVNLTFICTHNSRRSLMSQLWAQVAAYHYKIPQINCFSGGTEATAFNPRAIQALKRAGFDIERVSDDPNPAYQIIYAEGPDPVKAFSKKFTDLSNPQGSFAAVMTCSDADKACPIVPGAEMRFSIPFEDPKVADNTPEEEARYDERCFQIANEMFYLFSNKKE